MSYQKPHQHQDYLEGFANAWVSPQKKKPPILPIRALKVGLAVTGSIAILIGFGLMVLAMPRHE